MALANITSSPLRLETKVMELAQNLADSPMRPSGMIKSALNLKPPNLQAFLGIEANFQSLVSATRHPQEKDVVFWKSANQSAPATKLTC